MPNNAGTNTIQRLVLIVVTILALQKLLIWFGKERAAHPYMTTNVPNVDMSLLTISTYILIHCYHEAYKLCLLFLGVNGKLHNSVMQRTA